MLQAKIINSVGLNNKDSDFQAGLTALINPWVVNWLQLTSTEITPWKWFILATRTNVTPNEQWLVYINLTDSYDITVWNNLKVWIELRQSNLNDITLNTRPFGDDIAEVKTGASFPSSNYIPIAETDGSGNITDLREFINLKNELTEASTFQLSELRGWNWKVLYTDANGRWQELPLGAAWQVLTSAGDDTPIWTSPSIDINALIEDTVWDMDADFFVKSDWVTNEKILVNRYRASDAEAIAWTSTTKFITPKQAKDNYVNNTDIVTWKRNITGTEVVPHFLWRVPKSIKINMARNLSQASFWLWNSSKQACVWGNQTSTWDTDASNVINYTNSFTGQITAVSSTTFTIVYSWTSPWVVLNHIAELR